MSSQYVLLQTNSYIIRMNREDNICWFHGKITREQAEKILREEGKGDGVFLVRECNTSVGDFVLSVLHKGEVCHYQIRRHGEDAFFSIDNQPRIHGLDSLIEYYQESSKGLATQLSAIAKCDPPPNDSRSHGRTNLLHRATKESNQTVVSELLKCGYRNFDAKNQDGQTAVHLACIYSNEEILKLLINAGANINCRDTAGNTPLHYACRTKPASFIKTLINAKANIQTRNIDTGCVPLHDAARFGNMEAVKELLLLQAPHMPRSTMGEFPTDFAREEGHTLVTEFLQNYEPLSPETYESRWYHGTLERNEAVKLLQAYAGENFKEYSGNENNGNDEAPNTDSTAKDPNGTDDGLNKLNANQGHPSDGAFIVRFSHRSGYVLTLLCDNQAKHFKIQKAKTHLYIDEGPYLPSLEHLVQHYMNFSDGLPVNLRHPVPPKPKPPLPLFSTMPKAQSKKRNHTAERELRSTLSHDPSSTLTLSGRKLSHPGDDAMNRVGLFEENASPQLPARNETAKNDNQAFRSLKIRSPKRNVIIDGMKSLRKSKIKSLSKAKQSPNKQEATQSSADTNENQIIQLNEALLKNLSFSTDFLNHPISPDDFYNVPNNNCAVVDIDIGEGVVECAASEEDDKNGNSIGIENENKNESIQGEAEEKLQENEETESDYFTKSDKQIDMERDSEIKEYFIDAPPPLPPTSSTGYKSSPTTPSTFTGYIPTIALPVFFESSLSESNKALAESAAELRELSQHPERLDSMISTTSGDSEFSSFFNRQTSTSSSSTEHSRSRLNYFIPSECLTLEKIIGEGEFGSVFKGNLLKGISEVTADEDIKYPVAIKTLRDEHCRRNKQEFLREASVMIRLQHHCIVKLIGISKGQSLMMVQELVPWGSMLNYIVQNPLKINPNYELKIWASQIACGMNYLESQHFVHRDLAARNILLASRNQAKISDFGLSRALGAGNDCYQASQGGKWPIKWYAPESFNHGYFSHASDVWSFGVTIWEMFSMGKPPYGEMRGVDAIKLIEEGQRLPKPTLCPDNVYKIMENCWNYRPKDRPTFKYLTEYFAMDSNYQNLMELIKTDHIS